LGVVSRGRGLRRGKKLPRPSGVVLYRRRVTVCMVKGSRRDKWGSIEEATRTRKNPPGGSSRPGKLERSRLRRGGEGPSADVVGKTERKAYEFAKMWVPNIGRKKKNKGGQAKNAQVGRRESCSDSGAKMDRPKQGVPAKRKTKRPPPREGP